MLETMRNIVLFVGWPILVAGSVFSNPNYVDKEIYRSLRLLQKLIQKNLKRIP